MRILQVATLFTPDGEFGGPTRVAVNLARELAERGHEVTLAGAARGYAAQPREIDGVCAVTAPARQLVPGIGYAGLTGRGLRRLLRPEIEAADVVHLHLAREFVTLPAARAARRAGTPYVVQPHGMVDASDRLLARPLDMAITRPVLREAAAVLYLTGTERRRITDFAGPGLRLRPLRNGVPRPPADAAAPAGDGVPEVLFLARLHARKRPDLFVRVARELLGAGVDARFTVAGPDGGMAAAVDAEVAAGPGDRLRREPPVAPGAVTARLARAAIYVLPSVGEPYPMSVLEAMSVGRPVVVTRSCGLADAVERHRCGVVVDETSGALRDAIAQLLADPDAAAAAGERGRAAAAAEFGMSAIVDELERVYADAIEAGPVPAGDSGVVR